MMNFFDLFYSSDKNQLSLYSSYWRSILKLNVSVKSSTSNIHLTFLGIFLWTPNNCNQIF